MAVSGTPQLPEPWDQLTLRALAEKAAMSHPARAFLTDCPNRETWNGIEPRVLTADAYLKCARFLAAQLVTLGAARGERVLVLLPNCVEVAVTVLACHLADLVPALAPVDETPDFLRAAAERAGATMIVTTGRVGDVELGDKARQIAAKVMAIRCVAGFGFDLPDGIVSLEGWSDEDVMPLAEIERGQSAPGLVTFFREAGHVAAALRSEGQLVADALALSVLLKPDGRRPLVSLMHPGAAASVAIAITLPLFSGAGVRLVGPYESAALRVAFAAAPEAYLYCPDHFAAALDENALDPGMPGRSSGVVALTRCASLHQAIPHPGLPGSTLIVDFSEQGFAPIRPWPESGWLTPPGLVPHPVDTLLPEGMPFLTVSPAPDGGIACGGFGAARIIRRASASPGKAA